MKKCCKCKINKELESFNKNKTTWDNLSSECKECIKEGNMYRRYGITIKDYNKLFLIQNGKCAICKKHQSELSRSLDIDHCHNTGKVRGLLCSTCNQAIGLLYDNSELLQNAINYLKKTNTDKS